jgi:hypothetical protein
MPDMIAQSCRTVVMRFPRKRATQSPELPQHTKPARNKYITADGRWRGVTVRGSQMGLLESLRPICRAIAHGPHWRMKHPDLNAPISADFFAPPAAGDQQDAVA